MRNKPLSVLLLALILFAAVLPTSFAAAQGTRYDSDGDGIINEEDRCPNQPGVRSNNGCPITVPDPGPVVPNINLTFPISNACLVGVPYASAPVPVYALPVANAPVTMMLPAGTIFTGTSVMLLSPNNSYDVLIAPNNLYYEGAIGPNGSQGFIHNSFVITNGRCDNLPVTVGNSACYVHVPVDTGATVVARQAPEFASASAGNLSAGTRYPVVLRASSPDGTWYAIKYNIYIPGPANQWITTGMVMFVHTSASVVTSPACGTLPTYQHDDLTMWLALGL